MVLLRPTAEDAERYYPFVALDRTWINTYFGYSVAEFVSSEHDVLRTRFERAPTLNGHELPVYGEDGDETLENNAHVISISGWLR